jgi:hypothetical protein
MPTTMRTEGIRQSDRVSLRLPVEASWQGPTGQMVSQVAESLLISRNGGVLRMAEKLDAGQPLTLRRQTTAKDTKTARARIVAEIDHDPGGFLYAVAIEGPHADFWEIDFPSPAQAEEALARLLMECSFCQRREVVYLNELELKSFEARRCVARLCKFCLAPSIWIESLSTGRSGNGVSGEQDLATAQSRLANGQAKKETPSRNRTRVKARVLACIRRRGFQEEVAVCEDLSRGGLAFRSRNHYPEGTRMEVAVPYTPGSGAIFVPIRIVSARAIPAAGLYRHGAAYIDPPTS